MRQRCAVPKSRGKPPPPPVPNLVAAQIQVSQRRQAPEHPCKTGSSLVTELASVQIKMSQHCAHPQHLPKPPRARIRNPVATQVQLSQRRRRALPQHLRKPPRSVQRIRTGQRLEASSPLESDIQMRHATQLFCHINITDLHAVFLHQQDAATACQQCSADLLGNLKPQQHPAIWPEPSQQMRWYAQKTLAFLCHNSGLEKHRLRSVFRGFTRVFSSYPALTRKRVFSSYPALTRKR
eukprot:2509317-Rhodomonas_salina.1